MPEAEFIAQIMLWAVVLLLVVGYLNMPKTGTRKRTLDLQNHGLALQDRLPALEVRSIRDRSLAEDLNSGQASILLYTSAACQACNGLYPVLSEYADRLGVAIILFISGDSDAIDRKIKEYDIRVPVYPTDEVTLARSKITLFPFGYYVSRNGSICAKGGLPQPNDLDLLFAEGSYAEAMLKHAG